MKNNEIVLIEHLKFSEICTKCGTQINKGEPAFWDSVNKTDNYHKKCYKGPYVVMPKAEEPEEVKEEAPAKQGVSHETPAPVQTGNNMFSKTFKLLKGLGPKPKQKETEGAIRIGNEFYATQYLAEIEGKVRIKGTRMRVLDVIEALDNGMSQAKVASEYAIPIKAVEESISYYKKVSELTDAQANDDKKGNQMAKKTNGKPAPQEEEEEIGIKEAPAQESAQAPAKRGRGRPPKNAPAPKAPVKAQAPAKAKEEEPEEEEEAEEAEEKAEESPAEEPAPAPVAPKPKPKAAPQAQPTKEAEEARKTMEANLAVMKNTTILPVFDFSTTPREDGLIIIPYNDALTPYNISLKLSPNAIRKMKAVMEQVKV